MTKAQVIEGFKFCIKNDRCDIKCPIYSKCSKKFLAEWALKIIHEHADLTYNVGDDVWYLAELRNEIYIEHGTVAEIYIAENSITFGVYTSGVLYVLAESKLYKTFEEAKRALKERNND